MDDFLDMYVWLLAIAVIGFVVFWGFVIVLVVKFLKGDSGLSTDQKIGVLTQLSRIYGGAGRPSGPGPVETSARQTLIDAGIDPGR
jgi:hypothetical protein